MKISLASSNSNNLTSVFHPKLDLQLSRIALNSTAREAFLEFFTVFNILSKSETNLIRSSMKINVENLKEFSFIHGVVQDSELLNKWKKEILIETYPLDTTGGFP